VNVYALNEYSFVVLGMSDGLSQGGLVGGTIDSAIVIT
jgi:hypothetical protein